MSTKIYNGFKFKSKDISTIQKNLLKLTEPSIDIAASLVSNTIKIDHYISGLKNSSFKKDIDTLSILKDEKEPKYHLWKNLIEHHKEGFMPNSVPFLDFYIHIFAYKKDEIYGVWVGNNKYLRVLKPYILDFHYQNQSDRPENISEKEWNYRERVWDKMIKYFLEDTSLKRAIIEMSRIDFIDFKEGKIQKAFYNTLECINYKQYI